MTHSLAGLTTYQLALMIDTLIAERHLLQLNASLASRMCGGNMQSWLEARRDEVDANIFHLTQLAEQASDGSEDDQDAIDHIHTAARHVLQDGPVRATIGILISAHQAARAIDPDSEEAAAALGAAEDALFNFRPVTTYEHSARASYLLSDGVLDLSCWDTEDLRAFLLSMVG